MKSNHDNPNCINCTLYGKGCNGFTCLSYFRCDAKITKGTETAESTAEALAKIKANGNRPPISWK